MYPFLPWAAIFVGNLVSVMHIYRVSKIYEFSFTDSGYTYCERVAPGETTKTCRDIGAAQSFQSKLRENEVWKLYIRAYKKYFARVRKGTMSKSAFEAWSREAEHIRDEALRAYERASGAEARSRVTAAVGEKLNRV